MKPTLNPNYNLYESNGKPFCDSLQVAESFDKRHDHVMRDIENVLTNISKTDNPKFGDINFIQANYRDSMNRKQTKYLLSRDGFTLLAFGYDGDKAMQFKLDYIHRFNQMEQFIQSLLTSKVEFPAFTEAIMLAHEEPKHYHFSNEINMIYRIVLGVDAKRFRQENGISETESIKPCLTLDELKAIETLQRIDIGLIEAGLGFKERKAILSDRHSNKMLKLALVS